MNFASLSPDTLLYQLMANCRLDHEICLTECHDNALILECMECPYHHILTHEEENYVREQQLFEEEEV